MTFPQFVDKAFWALLLGVVAFGVHFLSDLSTTVVKLNEKLVVIVSHIAAEDDMLHAHEQRLNALELTPRRR